MRLAIGFDIGGSTIRAGLVRFEQESYRLLSEHRQLLSPDDKPPARLAEIIVRTVGGLIGQARCDSQSIEAVGIGLCGQLTDGGRRVVNSPHLHWRDVDFKGLLSPALGDRSVIVENDLNAILWGEYHFGRARGCTHVVAMFVGSGIGGATIVEGRLVRGVAGFAGEIGHVKLGGQVPCRCGEVGCAETIAGGYYLDARTTEDRMQGSLDEAIYPPLSRIGPADIDAAYLLGEGYALGLWGEVARTLSSLAACCIALIDPDMLLLGGGVLEHAPALVELVRNEVLQRIPESSRRSLRVELGELSPYAGVLGSARLALEDVT